MAIDIIGTLAVSTAAVLVADANSYREILSIYNAGAGTVMIGPATVGSLSGYPIPPASAHHILGGDAIYAIGAGAGTNLIHYHEVVS